MCIEYCVSVNTYHVSAQDVDENMINVHYIIIIVIIIIISDTITIMRKALWRFQKASLRRNKQGS